MTGAPLPPGADAVVMQERTRARWTAERGDPGGRWGPELRAHRRGEDAPRGGAAAPPGHAAGHPGAGAAVGPGPDARCRYRAAPRGHPLHRGRAVPRWTRRRATDRGHQRRRRWPLAVARAGGVPHAAGHRPGHAGGRAGQAGARPRLRRGAHQRGRLGGREGLREGGPGARWAWRWTSGAWPSSRASRWRWAGGATPCSSGCPATPPPRWSPSSCSSAPPCAGCWATPPWSRPGCPGALEGPLKKPAGLAHYVRVDGHLAGRAAVGTPARDPDVGGPAIRRRRHPPAPLPRGTRQPCQPGQAVALLPLSWVA